MPTSSDRLPNDIDQLKQIIQHHELTIAGLKAEFEAEYQLKLSDLLEQMRLAAHQKFGRSSEAAPGQKDLFNETEVFAEPDIELAGPIDEPVTTTPIHPAAKKKPGRKPIPSHLPRIEVIYELADHDNQCDIDGTALKIIGEEVTEQYDIVPAKVRVIRKITKTYACPQCESVKRATKPKEILPKSRATASLLAHIAIAKYQDALPLYRQIKQFERAGVEMDRTTLANWMSKLGSHLTPLIALAREDLLNEPVIHGDETTVQVNKEPGRRADQTSYMWTQVTATGPPIVLYHYAASRAQAVVNELYGEYSGTVVADGYVGYNALVHATVAGCWAHARRKFNDALKVQKGKRTGKAQIGFNLIQKLFVLEKSWVSLSAEARHIERQRFAAPLIAEIETWVQSSISQIAPKSLVGKALTYLNNQWRKLIVFLGDGNVPIHNNMAENKIRPFVIGRKNWLFSDSTHGADASAAIYSIIETAKANDLNPYTYLEWLLMALPNTDKHDSKKLRALLPYKISADQIAEDLAEWKFRLQGTGN